MLNKIDIEIPTLDSKIDIETLENPFKDIIEKLSENPFKDIIEKLSENPFKDIIEKL